MSLTVKNPIAGRCHCYVTPSNTGLRFASPRQCSRKAVVTRNVNGKAHEFCKYHDPVAEAARDDAQRAEWKAESDAKQAARNRQCAERESCKGMTDPVAEVAALKRKTAAADTLASELQYVLNDAAKYPQLTICEHQSDRLNRAMDGWLKALKGKS